MPNTYSPLWVETFLKTVPPGQTEKEVAFIAQHLPQPAYQTVLDLCCGLGRHTRLLAERGYRVTGVDRDAAILAEARKSSPGEITYLQQDMRQVADVSGSFNAVLILWQSFGYFDRATNTGLLRQICRKLNPGGRLILDIYHRLFFERHQGTYQFERNGLRFTSTQVMAGHRYTVQLDYGPDHPLETFNWQLYTPDEMEQLAGQLGFTQLLACTHFNGQQPTSADYPRMQIIWQKE